MVHQLRPTNIVRTMPSIAIRPATESDTAGSRGAFPDLLPDRWREGGNRRSFVAVRQANSSAAAGGVDDGTEVLGHCRGIDNASHPDSRTLVFEVAPELHGTEAERELLRVQIASSTLPLRSKLEPKNLALRALLARFDSVLVQLMPPWRYSVDAELRTWAESVLASTVGDAQVVPASQLPPATLHTLEVDHYITQHESWSPAASRPVLLDQLADDHDPSSASTWDHTHSRAVISHDGDVLAAALVWGAIGAPGDPATGDEAPEISHLSQPYASPEAWTNKLRAIAGVVASVPLGTELCIDSHLSMRDEFACIGSIPGVDREAGEWTAIVATPVPGGPPPIPLDLTIIPDAAVWAREFSTSES